jgi:hypothetical protein
MIGMGDIISLTKKAERGLDAAETQRLAQHMVKNQLTWKTCATRSAASAGLDATMGLAFASTAPSWPVPPTAAAA